MTQNESLKADYSKLIATEKYQINLSQQIADKATHSAVRFSFIDLNQWLLLLLLNLACLSFIIFACSLTN